MPVSHSALYCTALFDNTIVMLNGIDAKTLSRGQTAVYVTVQQGNRLTATQNVQVTHVTGRQGEITCAALLPSHVPATMAPSVSPSEFPTMLPSISPSETLPVSSPDLWKVTLVGCSCSEEVYTKVDLIQEELFMVFQAHVPGIVYVPPGESSNVTGTDMRSLADADQVGDRTRRQLGVDVCPRRCNKPRFAGTFLQYIGLRGEISGLDDSSRTCLLHRTQSGACSWAAVHVEAVTMTAGFYRLAMPRSRASMHLYQRRL